MDVQDSAGLAGLETALWALVPVSGWGRLLGLYRWFLLMEKRLSAAESR